MNSNELKDTPIRKEVIVDCKNTNHNSLEVAYRRAKEWAIENKTDNTKVSMRERVVDGYIGIEVEVTINDLPLYLHRQVFLSGLKPSDNPPVMIYYGCDEQI